MVLPIIGVPDIRDLTVICIQHTNKIYHKQETMWYNVYGAVLEFLRKCL